MLYIQSGALQDIAFHLHAGLVYGALSAAGGALTAQIKGS